MFKLSIINDRYAPLAQLDRASGYGPEGQGFESLTACHLFITLKMPLAEKAQVFPRMPQPFLEGVKGFELSANP